MVVHPGNCAPGSVFDLGSPLEQIPRIVETSSVLITLCLWRDQTWTLTALASPGSFCFSEKCKGPAGISESHAATLDRSALVVYKASGGRQLQIAGIQMTSHTVVLHAPSMVPADLNVMYDMLPEPGP